MREITTSVPGFSTENYDVFRGCGMGKYARARFLKRDRGATCILDLMHTYVSGRMSHVSLSGYGYYVIFIDDYSRKS